MVLQGVTKDGLGNEFLSFRIGPIVLFALLIFFSGVPQSLVYYIRLNLDVLEKQFV